MSFWQGRRDELLDRAATADLWDNVAGLRRAAGNSTGATSAHRSAARARLALELQVIGERMDHLLPIGEQLLFATEDPGRPRWAQ